MLLAAVLAVLMRVWDLSLALAALVLALWIVKDLALFPILRIAYEPAGGSGGAENLIGALGIVSADLDPEGWVRIGAERWRARVSREHAPVRPVDGARHRGRRTAAARRACDALTRGGGCSASSPERDLEKTQEAEPGERFETLHREQRNRPRAVKAAFFGIAFLAFAVGQALSRRRPPSQKSTRMRTTQARTLATEARAR